MVGDDALVTALVRKRDAPQVQDSGVLHHTSAWRLRCRTPVVCVNVGVILRLSMPKQLLVLPPREGHGGRAAACGRAGQTHITTKNCDGGFGLHSNLGLGEVV